MSLNTWLGIIASFFSITSSVIGLLNRFHLISLKKLTAGK